MTETYVGYKPYQEKAGNKFDDFAKTVSSQFLCSLIDHQGNPLFRVDVPVLDQEEQYKKYDYILLDHNNKPVKVETECKYVWTKEGQWQYHPDGVHVPIRKRYSSADLFVMVNRSGNTLCLTKMATVKKSKVTVKSTNVRTTNTKTKSEMFFNVPTQEVLFFKRTTNGWIEFKHI